MLKQLPKSWIYMYIYVHRPKIAPECVCCVHACVYATARHLITQAVHFLDSAVSSSAQDWYYHAVQGQSQIDEAARRLGKKSIRQVFIRRADVRHQLQ